MIDRAKIKEQLNKTLVSVDAHALGKKISGKVRDCYLLGDRRVIIVTDRLSAFDVVLTTIPFKGQILNQMALYWFEETKHIIDNHILETPHPNVIITKEVEILPVEVIVRGYLAGSAWRDYQAGNAVSGIKLPSGFRKSQMFDRPLLTPSTKAEHGKHDQPISCEEIVSTGLVDAKIWHKVEESALALFACGSAKAREQGLILVDTKYEFGLLKDKSGNKKLVLADEVHTQDSSRYWIADSYSQRFEQGDDPIMLDKEFVRSWLIEQGYMGDGTPPSFSDEIRIETCVRYIQSFERICGQEFKVNASSNIAEDIINSLKDYSI